MIYKNTQLQMIDFKTSVARFWKNYFVFSGTAKRSECLFAFLFWILVACPLIIISFDNPIFIIIWCLATFFPILSLIIRRFHDVGLSAKWIIFSIIYTIILWTIAFITTLSCCFLTNGTHDTETAIWGFTVNVTCLILLSLPIVMILPSKLKNNKYRKQK